MKYKISTIVLVLTITAIFGVLMGVTYAWYAYDDAKTSIVGKAIKETPTIIFAKTDQILYRNIMPIYDNDKYNYAGKNSFTITLDEKLSKYSTNVEIVLDNIKMSDELKIANYKYELLENNVSIQQGDFSTIGNSDKIVLKKMSLLKPEKYPETYSYDLLIWLSEDGTDQNDLMNKVFSAKVNINSSIKK